MVGNMLCVESRSVDNDTLDVEAVVQKRIDHLDGQAVVPSFHTAQEGDASDLIFDLR